MDMASIRTLKRNVTEEDAVRTFSAPGVSAYYWRMRTGPLQRIAEAYVPFWLYRVRYRLGSAAHTRFFALDAVDGSLDLFEFPGIPAPREFMCVECRNRLATSLTEERAGEILRDKVLRVIFQQGFFKLREPRLELEKQLDELYLPFWLGFYGGSGAVRCRVLDAVRHRVEGAKASAFFEQWLAT